MDINDAIIVLRARMKSLIRKIDAPEREALQTAISVMEKERNHGYRRTEAEEMNMYGFVSGLADADGVEYCPFCGSEVDSKYADGSCRCGECKRRFYTLELDEDDE